MKSIILLIGFLLTAPAGFAQPAADSSEQLPSIQTAKELFEKYKSAGKKKDSVAYEVSASFDSIAADIARIRMLHQEAFFLREQDYEMELLSVRQSDNQLQQSTKKKMMWAGTAALTAVVFLLIMILILFQLTAKHRRIVEDKNDAIEQQKKVLEHFTEQLQGAHERIKMLQSILPLCPSCKKQRDDKAYLSKVEKHLPKQEDPSFKLALCSECAKKLYPGVFGKMK